MAKSSRSKATTSKKINGMDDDNPLNDPTKSKQHDGDLESNINDNDEADDDWEKTEEDEEWDKDFDEFDMPDLKNKPKPGSKSFENDDDDFKPDEELDDFFNENDERFEDNDNDEDAF